MRIFATLASLPLLLLLLAACGDDDDAEATATPAEPVQVVLFFANADATGHVEVTREIGGPATIEEAINLLLDGPTDSERTDLGATRSIPEGTRLLGAEFSGGVVTLDFSEEMLDYGGGSARVLSIVESIRLTATAIGGIEDVVILVEGQPDALQP